MEATKNLDKTAAIRSVRPNMLRVSAYNERAAATDASDGRTSFEVSTELKNSIRETGFVDLPLVRETDDPDFDYEVVVGARRVRAVQHLIADGELPDDYETNVIVMDWTDYESLRASITENIEAFRKNVSRSLRCAATIKLWRMAREEARAQGEEEPAYADFVVNTLGVKRSTATLWFERANKPWPRDSAPVEVKPAFSDRTATETRTSDSPKQSVPETTSSGPARSVDREDAAAQVANAKSRISAKINTPASRESNQNKSEDEDDEFFVLPPRYDFISDTKLNNIRLMIQNHTDALSEQQAWARRCLDRLEEFHAAGKDSDKPYVTFDFTEPDTREAKRVAARRDLTPTEALDWVWNNKIEGVAKQEYGSARVLFSVRGEDKVRLQYLAAIKRTTQEEIGRVALEEFLADNRELARTGLSIEEMNKRLESHKNDPSELAKLHEEDHL